MKNKRHARRVKRLALICTMCTIILVVSTYAWFIGMKTVNVSSFEVEIAATDGLSLSLNGQYWDESVNISKDTYKYKGSAVAAASDTYDGNTNTWGGKGLVPISTVGEINSTSSRLVMYEKGSLTTTHGGYRLMASKVDNYTVTTANTEEGSGYVAFDLFVRNLSGNEYYTEFNQKNEEAIYLTQSSKVSVVTAGATDQEKTGIENSVRVAFAQIGRVKAVKDPDIGTAAAKKVTDITCATTTTEGSKEGVTGACTRYAQIWEPNDKAHVDNAIAWYNTACKARSGEDVTATASYSGLCESVANGKYSQTYAVGKELNYDNNIDVYDGAAYNKYTTSISATKVNGNSVSDGTGKITLSDAKLYEYDYFTDSEKMLTGMDRPTFITLAPNSITKIRVYVYLEGQDVDNYDFASLGKKISVSFGFTKERFFGSDINYEGPTGVPTTPEHAS